MTLLQLDAIDSPAAAIRDLLDHRHRLHHPPAFDLPREAAVLQRPFCTLRRFAHDGRGDAPVVLIVAPLSGQFAAFLRETVAALLPDHDVAVTDWKDAAMVPAREGRFGLDDQIGYIIDFVRILGRDTHLIAMSQSGVPVLAAAALMGAMADPARPRSIALMGALIDTRINPTPMNVMARRSLAPHFLSPWSEQALTRRVPAGYPGAGRRVYPGSYQLAGLITYLLRRLGPGKPTPLQVFQSLLVGDGAPAAAHRRLYDDFLTLMDLPAEVYLQTAAALFREHALPTGRLTWRGQRVEPAAIRDTALMTVEGARDDISGRGQTRAAQDLCVNLPAALRLHHEEPEIGHLGLFHGRRWRESILPRFRAFIRAVA